MPGRTNPKQPRKEPEPFTWKCKEKGCGISGRAATKDDAKTALQVHMLLKHGK